VEKSLLHSDFDQYWDSLSINLHAGFQEPVRRSLGNSSLEVIEISQAAGIHE
jgi:hypothetical protein